VADSIEVKIEYLTDRLQLLQSALISPLPFPKNRKRIKLQIEETSKALTQALEKEQSQSGSRPDKSSI
jgi:hypothetical protein